MGHHDKMIDYPESKRIIFSLVGVSPQKLKRLPHARWFVRGSEYTSKQRGEIEVNYLRLFFIIIF